MHTEESLVNVNLHGYRIKCKRTDGTFCCLAGSVKGTTPKIDCENAGNGPDFETVYVDSDTTKGDYTCMFIPKHGGTYANPCRKMEPNGNEIDKTCISKKPPC